MELAYGEPFTGRRLQALQDFLRMLELDYDDGVTFTVTVLEDDGAIIATGSLQRNVLKCIAVSEEHQGEGLTATVITALKKRAFEAGERHLFLYTKPRNERMFADLGFYSVAKAQDSMLMESQRHGARQFARSLRVQTPEGTIGAIVANCNPFTNGHLYLVETAARECGLVYLFILSEDRSEFPAAARLELARQGVAHLQNVVVQPTGDYMVSSATFPSYFIKDKTRVDDVRCALDLAVFSDVFARELQITRRYVGTEPLSPVTNEYNRQMKLYLPPRGVEVVEVSRRNLDEEPISASRVRALLARHDLGALRPLVPPTTYAYLEEQYHSPPPR